MADPSAESLKPGWAARVGGRFAVLVGCVTCDSSSARRWCRPGRRHRQRSARLCGAGFVGGNPKQPPPLLTGRDVLCRPERSGRRGRQPSEVSRRAESLERSAAADAVDAAVNQVADVERAAMAATAPLTSGTCTRRKTRSVRGSITRIIVRVGSSNTAVVAIAQTDPATAEHAAHVQRQPGLHDGADPQTRSVRRQQPDPVEVLGYPGAIAVRRRAVVLARRANHVRELARPRVDLGDPPARGGRPQVAACVAEILRQESAVVTGDRDRQTQVDPSGGPPIRRVDAGDLPAEGMTCDPDAVSGDREGTHIFQRP